MTDGPVKPPVSLSDALGELAALIRELLQCLLLYPSLLFGAIGVPFFSWKHNIAATLTCFAVDFFCLYLIYLNFTVKHGLLKKVFSQSELQREYNSSAFLATALFVCSIVFLAMGIKLEQGFKLEDDGFYVAVIPSFMASLFAFITCFELRAQYTALGEMTTVPNLAEQSHYIQFGAPFGMQTQ